MPPERFSPARFSRRPRLAALGQRYVALLGLKRWTLAREMVWVTVVGG
ncbi:MAG: hypothetical protein O3A53_10315 [Acidobacteria bacterium]|nr:hypothetical protein [Acidobacteriota bacterium]MDA1235183.1 hypothetical protein [Acidobacteriota bacterium]